MTSKAKIDSSQLVILLILSRIFTLLTFSTQSREESIIYVGMVGYAGAALIQLIVLIPCFILLKRNKECGIIECSLKANKYYGKVVTVLYMTLMLFQAAHTAASFEFFMTTSIYPTAPAWVFIAIFLLAVMYSAYMGIEAFSRMGGFVAVGVIVGTLILVISNWRQMDLVYFQNPFHDGIMPILRSSYHHSNVSLELVLYMILIPYVKINNVVKPIVNFLIVSVVYFEVVIFSVLLSLGNIANSKMFPVFAMAIISEMAFLERLDAIYMGIWIFIAFVRTSMLIFLSAELLKYIVTEKIASKGILICGAVTFAVSMYFSKNIEALTRFSQIIFAGVVISVFVFGIPSLTLLLTWKKSEVKQK